MSAKSEIRWDDVAVFLAVARGGTLTAAAEALHVNVSTVHRRIGGLETGLRTRLFDREPAGLTLTAAGEDMLPLAERVEEAMATLRRRVAGQDQSPAGSVKLTAPESLLPLLVEPLAAFRASFPRIELTVRFADRFLDLARREADVAVRPSERPPENAAGRRVAAVAWGVYAGVQHPDATSWAIYTDELGTRLAASAWWRQHHSHDDVLLSVNSVPAMQTVVACAPCRGLLPCFVGDAADDLVRQTDPIDQAASALWILVHPDLRKTARIRALTTALWDALVTERDLFEGRLSSA